MLGKDYKIKKFPYLSYSPNIIEYFAIVGYLEKTIPQIIDCERSTNGIAFSPSLLSFISSETNFELTDKESIISQIYPYIPFPIKKEKNQEPPSPSNVIYSFCLDTPDGKNKLFQVYYAYKFYEKFTYTEFGDYYIPKAFVIISQYSYFTLFKYICENLYNLIYENNKVKQNSIPLEIIIYNIVNFIPSPINYKLHLNIFDEICDEGEVQLGLLSGYPYLQFDIGAIFDLLPINMILEIYIFSVLEKSILFFSSNLEILNMIMFIIYKLNYPCNDSTYFWYIVSVSEKNFVEENKYVGKLISSMLGVNSTFREDIDTSVFEKYHFVVDIDNKNFFLKKAIEDLDDEEEDFNKLKNLFLYIENIFKLKDKDIEKSPDSIFLKPFIQRIKKYLEQFLKRRNPEFTPYKKNKYVNFFRASKDIMENNKIFQELFYDFSLNILMVFYQENILNSTFSKIIKDKDEEFEKRIKIISKFKEEIQMDKDEKEFYHLYRRTNKYKIYFQNFIRNSEVIDIFKIPFFFSEEFINIKTKDPSNKIINRLSLFTIIDSLYSNNNISILNITFKNIIIGYDDFRNYFKYFFDEEKNNKFEESINNRLDQSNKNRPQRQLFVLNKKIIEKYKYFLNNFYDRKELLELFPSIQIQKESLITNIDRNSIIYSIQTSLEKQNLIDSIDYLIYALVIIYAFSFPLHSYAKILGYLEKLISSLGRTKFFIRQHT